MMVFVERGKTGVPGEKPKTNLTQIWRRRRDWNPGHIDGIRVFSPLRDPCTTPLGEKPKTNLTQIWRRRRDWNPGHIDGIRVFSPLRDPCTTPLGTNQKLTKTTWRLPCRLFLTTKAIST